MNGIDKCCIMSMENPEETHYYQTTENVLADCLFSSEFIPFCNVDPRIGAGNEVDFFGIIKEYVDRGARGFGEIIVEMPIDSPRLLKIYDVCGKFGLPVLIHMDFVRGKDEIGLPKLRRVLSGFPRTNFILHASHFWAELSGNVTEPECRNNKASLGKPIVPNGAVQQIFSEYKNAFGDLSALSAYNNLMRFKDNGKGFLETWHEHLLFGTDYLEPGQECPIIKYIKTIGISDKAYRSITHENAERILRPE
ncbi:MAG: amidohydrolase family protein [Candidatus Omnitrophica bacterium]|nr:amidohydrolase family protein [Candidatus Omnitrophota bacterium]